MARLVHNMALHALCLECVVHGELCCMLHTWPIPYTKMQSPCCMNNIALQYFATTIWLHWLEFRVPRVFAARIWVARVFAF